MSNWISYTGSKKNEYKKIFKDVDLSLYTDVVDLFGGSGWVSLRILSLFPKINIHLNDTDKELFELWKYLQ